MKLKPITAAVLTFFCLFGAVSARQPFAAEDFAEVMDNVIDAYVESVYEDADRIAEVENQEMVWGDAVMRYTIQVIGEADEDGYPLYICLHGGGSSDTPDVNDEQWAEMREYYLDSVSSGVYVAVRGVRDTWDTHFNPESYPLYDKLIENMILFFQVDPNRVYLSGFSAGGDGVYAISPRMADRFAAVNMSSGHPNGVDLRNLRNLPIALQAGVDDTMFERNIETGKYGAYLDDLQNTYGGFEHVTWLHQGYGHNYPDNDPYGTPQEVLSNPMQADAAANGEYVETTYTDTNAIHFLDRYVRDPNPESVLWNLAVRAEERSVESFYWLKADPSVTEGVINASFDANVNAFSIETEGLNGDFSILLKPGMVDFNAPVTFVLNGKTVKLDVEPDSDILYESLVETGDPYLMWAAEVSSSSLSAD